MAVTLRLSKWEQEGLRKAAIRVNRLLVKEGQMPLKESEILHLILQESIPFLDVEDGVLVIRAEDELKPGQMSYDPDAPSRALIAAEDKY